jgi:hypothetical protein
MSLSRGGPLMSLYLIPTMLTFPFSSLPPRFSLRVYCEGPGRFQAFSGGACLDSSSSLGLGLAAMALSSVLLLSRVL